MTCEPDTAVQWRPARDLAPWLEHDGTINDEEYATPGGHLAMLADAGAHLSADDPLVINVTTWDDGQRASVHDGNHRLILILADDPDQMVPYVIERDLESTFPGHPYHGELDGRRIIAVPTRDTQRASGLDH